MELHFYPGQHLLVGRDQNTVKVRVEAWGGPDKMGTDARMPEEPTWPGTYVIDSAHPYNTASWPYARIRWGTKLQDKPELNDVWHELANGKWASVSKDFGITRNNIKALHAALYVANTVPATWVFNDFGPIAIRWFKDLNGNRRLDGKEQLSGQMFHTTPINEAQHARGLTVELTASHGCIHLKPADRDQLFALGAFKPKTVFVVHEYHEKA
ncbi:MAG: L,D-transpeptidase family protein [Pseudomonas sp.]|uniref:L,D-transpeptidase family protein n=1 Tax=Pseudomonas sp. TaxID=306 RepID=UPI00339601E5